MTYLSITTHAMMAASLPDSSSMPASLCRYSLYAIYKDFNNKTYIM